MRLKGFVGASYESQSYTADQEDCINLYVERVESPGAQVRSVLCPTPGQARIHTTSDSGGRAHGFFDGREFIIIGGIFFEMDADLNTTFLGFVAVDSNPATISWNGEGGGELFITSGGNGYLLTLATNTFAAISALAGKATMGDQLDGYFLALDAATGTMYASELLDGATWTTGIMFAQRNAAPDPWVAMKVLGSLIWLMGSQTSEVWYDAGTSPFPFLKHPAGLIPYGIAAPFSVTISDDAIMWLGASKSGHGFVLKATGFSPEVVSTYAVQFDINGFETVSDGYGDSYTEAGHTFYVLGFPAAGRTWGFDLQMGLWHKRASWSNGVFGVWRPRCHAACFGEHRWLDTLAGHVLRLSLDYGTDVRIEIAADDVPIRRVRRAPALESENRRITYPGFELGLDKGLGLTSGQGVNPQVMMRFSDDGGKTWSRERWASAGKLGEYDVRVRWDRLGQARQRVFEVIFSDPVPWRITDAYLTPEPQVEAA